MSLGIPKSLRKGAEGNPLACLHPGVSWVLGGGIWTLPTKGGGSEGAAECADPITGTLHFQGSPAANHAEICRDNNYT